MTGGSSGGAIWSYDSKKVKSIFSEQHQYYLQATNLVLYFTQKFHRFLAGLFHRQQQTLAPQDFLINY